MDEQIVKSLIEFYKEKGIDLYAVIDDPLFIGLPIKSKVEMLKKFASHISSGTSKTLTKSDIRGVLTDAGLAGILSAGMATGGIGLALAHYGVGGKIPFRALAGGIAVGSGISALSSFIKSRNILNNRIAVADRLDTLTANPNDSNAIKVLALRNSQIHPNRNLSTPSAMMAMVKQKVSGAPNTFITDILPKYTEFKTYSKNEYNETPLAEGVVQSDLSAKIDKLSKNIFPNPLSPKHK